MKEIGAIMKKLLVLATIYLIFVINAFSQPYIRVYRTSGGQLYGELEDYNQDTTGACVRTQTPAFLNDTLTNEDCRNQFYFGTTIGTVTLPTMLDDGKIFTIGYFPATTATRTLSIYQNGSGTSFDQITGGNIRDYIYISSSWYPYRQGSGGVTNYSNIILGDNARSIGADNIMIGREAFVASGDGTIGIGSFPTLTAGSVGIGYNIDALAGYCVSVGYESFSQNSCVAYGYSTYSLNSSVALGYNANAQNNSIVVGRDALASTGGVALGYDSDGRNKNVSLGYQAGKSATRGNNLFIENSSDTLTPLIYGEFDNDYIKINDSLAVGNLEGTGTRFVTTGADGQLIAGDTVTAYSLPSGTLSQTLRHDGTGWESTDIFKVTATPSLVFTGSGSTERFKVNPGGEITSSALSGTGVRNVVCNASGELQAGFGSYSVAAYTTPPADDSITTSLTQSSISFSISSNEVWAFEIVLYAINLSTTADQNIYLQLEKTGSDTVQSCVGSITYTYYYSTLSDYVMKQANSYLNLTDIANYATVYGSILGDGRSIIKINGVVENDGDAGTFALFWKKDPSADPLYIRRVSHITATKVP